MSSPILLFLPLTAALLTLLPEQVNAAPDELIPLQRLAASYGFPGATSSPNVITLQSQYRCLAFHTGSRRFVFNNRLFWLNGAVSKDGQNWCISRADAESIVAPLLQSRRALKGQGCSLVVLDPGHGGSDPGTVSSRRIDEKRLVLDITKRVKRKLNASNVAVRMTRSRDTTLSLQDRPKRAARWGGDVFVSIHANSASSTACGIETFVMPAAGFPSTASSKPESRSYKGNKHDAVNTLLAGLVQHGALAHTGATDRGVKRARFAVLRDAPCPAALVEVGFLSNQKEAAQLTTVAYRDAVAQGIAHGILTYLVKAEASQ